LISDDAQTAGQAAVGAVRIRSGRRGQDQLIVTPKLSHADLTPDGNYLLGMGDKIYVWESLGPKPLYTIDVEAKDALFGPDNKSLIYATTEKLAVRDVPDNREQFSVALPSGHSIEAIRGVPEGKFVATAETWAEPDGKPRYVVAVYDLEKSERAALFEGHARPITRLAISRDGKLAASASDDGIVKVWDLALALAPAH
jgi:WD40 repeat protein